MQRIRLTYRQLVGDTDETPPYEQMTFDTWAEANHWADDMESHELVWVDEISLDSE